MIKANLFTSVRVKSLSIVENNQEMLYVGSYE